MQYPPEGVWHSFAACERATRAPQARITRLPSAKQNTSKRPTGTTSRASRGRCSSPCSRFSRPLGRGFLTISLRPAGNPAVIAPRFRPVALRPRLSAGLPQISKFNMPNMARRNKRDGSRIRSTTGSRLSNQTDSVKDLLAKLTPNLKRVTDQVHRQDFWRDWLEKHLPAEISGKLTGIVERDGTLVIFAESPAWSARLRFAVQEIEAQIRAAKPGITEVSVRVLPRGAKS